jgi:sensor histidine kinase regulating citrate/malate metabolism
MYNCTLNKELQIDTNMELKGRSGDLIYVITNLIKNAIECYDGKGGKIDFKIIRDENGINFSVKDYGKGIPEKIQEKIFKNMVSTKGMDGTGLGLYVRIHSKLAPNLQKATRNKKFQRNCVVCWRVGRSDLPRSRLEHVDDYSTK